MYACINIKRVIKIFWMNLRFSDIKDNIAKWLIKMIMIMHLVIYGNLLRLNYFFINLLPSNWL